MPEIRRDRWSRYLIVPPSGDEGATGYTRATTVAKALDDQGGLMPWKATLAMTGLMRRAGLRGRFEALMAQAPGDGPWYGGPQSKAECKKLVEECAEAGGSADRADLGTAHHAIFEQHDLGNAPIPAQESTRLDLGAYVRTMAAAGITYDPTMIEAVVVLDGPKVAGMTDRGVCHVPGYDLPMIGDLKTGDDLKYSWQSIAVQLAIYAHADAVYEQGPAGDGSQDVRRPMPAVSQEHALVIHSPAGKATTDLYIIDIVAGWEAFTHSMWAREWRTRKALARPYIVTPVSVPAVALADGGDVPAPSPSAEPPPFNPVALAPEAVSDAVDPLAASAPAEGADFDDVAYSALAANYGAAGPGRRAWITFRGLEASNAGLSFAIKERHSLRRFEIMRALISLSVDYAAVPPLDAPMEMIKALLAPILGDDVFASVGQPIGVLIGSLDVVGARAFALAADAFADGQMIASIEQPSGFLRLRSSRAA